MAQSTIKDLLAALPPAQRDALMNEAMREAQKRANKTSATDYTTEDGIVRFCREVLQVEPTPYQERILRALVKHKRVCVRSPHGAGKTALASWVTLWGMYAFDTDVKIPTTASAWRQLQLYLWPEIRYWARRANLSGMRILDLSLKAENKEAFALASDTPALIEGAHATTLIYVFDEAKAIPNDTWDAAEGAFSGAGTDTAQNAYALAISTPGNPSGRFYDIQSRKRGYEDWYPIHVSLDECIQAGRISATWAEQKRVQWGDTSPVYLTRVKGEFADQGENSLIPLSWVEAANERWQACAGKGTGAVSWGVDPARYGDDQTTVAHMVGRVLEQIHRYSQQSTMETTGRVAMLAKYKDALIAVDTIGLGSGVFDRLREIGFSNAIPVNVSESTTLKDASGTQEFTNLRAAIWWLIRDALEPDGIDPIALPPDDTLTGDLCAPTYSYDSRGKIKIESKDDIRRRIGRSTDDADSLALALYAALKARPRVVHARRDIDALGGSWMMNGYRPPRRNRDISDETFASGVHRFGPEPTPGDFERELAAIRRQKRSME